MFWLRVCVVLTVFLSGNIGFCQSAQTEELRRWIGQLDSDDYFVREQATQRLLTAGAKAEPALTAALESPDMEMRTRSKRILELIEFREQERRRIAFEQKLAAFVARPDDFAAEEFPAWQQFSERFGSGRSEREFYTEMAKVNQDLFVALQSDAVKAGEEVKRQLEHLRTVVQPHIQANTGQFTLDPYFISSLLFTSLTLKQDIHADYDVLLNWAFYREPIKGFQSQPVFRELLVTWLETPQLSLSEWNRLRLMMEYELEEALPFVVEVLEKSQKSSTVNSHALVFLGKYGGKEHLPLLESFLENDRVCHIHIRNNERYYVQIRDLALAVLITLTEQSHHDYNFKRIEYDQKQLYRVWTLGFRKDQQDLRKQALSKWKQWSKEHLPPPAEQP